MMRRRGPSDERAGTLDGGRQIVEAARRGGRRGGTLGGTETASSVPRAALMRSGHGIAPSPSTVIDEEGRSAGVTSRVRVRRRRPLFRAPWPSGLPSTAIVLPSRGEARGEILAVRRSGHAALPAPRWRRIPEAAPANCKAQVVNALAKLGPAFAGKTRKVAAKQPGPSRPPSGATPRRSTTT